jgi:hypothetical protein
MLSSPSVPYSLAMQTGSGILRVVRSSQFANRARSIALFLDGREIGTVRNGESIDLAVDAGEHDVHAAIDGVLSETVRVACAAGTPTVLRLSSPLTGWKLLRVQQAMGGPPGSFITLEVLPGAGNDPR